MSTTALSNKSRYFSVQLENPKFKFRLETKKLVPLLKFLFLFIFFFLGGGGYFFIFFISLELRATMCPNSSSCEGPA